MDRRIVAGLLGLALVGSSRTSFGMQMRDPTATGTVGYAPIDPIDDRINNSAAARTIPATVPTDPTTSGPAARVPTPPVGPYPVQLVPEPPINESIDEGYSPTGFGWFGRRARRAAATQSAASARTNPPSRPKVDPATIPSGMAWDETDQSPKPMSAVPAGRPAPFAGQLPDYPRPQAGPRPIADGRETDGAAPLGRPAPFADEVPGQPRPRLGKPEQDQPQPRPRSGPLRQTPTPGPAPVIPATLPEIEPESQPLPDPHNRLPDPPTSLLTDPRKRPAEPPTSRLPLPEALESAPPELPALESGPSPMAAPTAEPDAKMPEAPTALPALEPVNLPPTAAGAGDAPTILDPLPPLDPGGLTPATPLDVPRSLPALDPSNRPPGAGPTAPPPSIDNIDDAAAQPPRPVLEPLPQLASTPSNDPSSGPVDQALTRTSADSAALRIESTKTREPDRPFASARAAAVGDEIITVHQVQLMVVEKYKSLTHGQQIPEAERHDMINALGTMALDRLIDQSLVLQEAKRRMKNPKMKQQFDDFVDKRWRDEKLPGLLQKYGSTNEYELRRKLANEGESYPEMMESYRKEMLEHDFLFNEVKNKINVDLARLKLYYNDHLDDFAQPARISWREIEINVAKYPDRLAARRQADLVLARLRREDFATVAAAASDGPTASKGGLYADMSPDSYGIAPVNSVLGEIPVGTLSPVIEAPNSIHIVRVESRRAAGPLRFDEVQKKIADAVFEEGFGAARDQYLAKLRSRTLVRVMPMFEQAKKRMEQQEAAEGQIRPASRR